MTVECERLTERLARLEALEDERMDRINERFIGFELVQKEREKALDERATSQKIAVDAALLAAEKAVDAALKAAEKAVIVAQTSQEKVNEKQNEFRQALIDQQGTFTPRESFEATMREVNRRLEGVENATNRGVGEQVGGDRAIAAAVQARQAIYGLILVVIAVASFVIARAA